MTIPLDAPQLGLVRVIGAGRAGGSFSRALRDAGYEVDGPWERGRSLATACEGVQCVLICVSDDAVAEVAAHITPVPGVVMAHVAGSLGLDVFAHRFDRVGSIHPLVSLTDPEAGSTLLAQGATFAVAGDDLLHAMVLALGGRCVEVPDVHRAAYHAAACIASNHLVALMGQVERVGAGIGLPFEVFLGLVEGTLANVARVGPGRALTGPAARGDQETLNRHLAALDPSERGAYEAMMACAQRLARETASGQTGSG